MYEISWMLLLRELFYPNPKQFWNSQRFINILKTIHVFLETFTAKKATLHVEVDLNLSHPPLVHITLTHTIYNRNHPITEPARFISNWNSRWFMSTSRHNSCIREIMESDCYFITKINSTRRQTAHREGNFTVAVASCGSAQIASFSITTVHHIELTDSNHMWCDMIRRESI